MTSINLFYQGEGLGDIAHIELDSDATFVVLKSRLVEKHGVPHDALLFLEDEDQPLDEFTLIKDRATAKGLKVLVAPKKCG